MLNKIMKNSGCKAYVRDIERLDQSAIWKSYDTREGI